MEGYSRNSQEENHVFKGVNSMSTTEAENKAQLRRIYEEMFNQGNLAIADELIAPDFLNHAAPPGSNRGPESMRQLITMLSTAFPDMHYTVEELVAEGDTVVTRVTVSGTIEDLFKAYLRPVDQFDRLRCILFASATAKWSNIER